MAVRERYLWAMSRSEIPPVNYAEIQGASFILNIIGKYVKYGKLEEIVLNKLVFHTNSTEIFKMFVNFHQTKRIFTFFSQISKEIFT